MRQGRLRLKRKAMLVEPPAAASSDIAFNLIVFFLVCASNAPDSGHPQSIPRSEQQQTAKAAKNVEVSVASQRLLVNAEPVEVEKLSAKISGLLAGKNAPDERIIVVKSAGDTPYDRWIDVTRRIENAGGIITLQLEEERRVELK